MAKYSSPSKLRAQVNIIIRLYTKMIQSFTLSTKFLTVSLSQLILAHFDGI